MKYPKMGTLFALDAGKNGKWWKACDRLYPDTAGLHFVDPAQLVFTEKIDGANMWLHVGGDGVDGIGVGKRNGECSRDDRSDAFYYEVVPALPADLQDRFGAAVLYGELVGPKVQSSGRLYPKRQFVLFDVLSTKGVFFRWEAVKAVADTIGVAHVPELEGPKVLAFDVVRDYVCSLQSAVNPSVPAEGIVVRDRDDVAPMRRRIAKIRRTDFPREKP